MCTMVYTSATQAQLQQQQLQTPRRRVAVAATDSEATGANSTDIWWGGGVPTVCAREER